MLTENTHCRNEELEWSLLWAYFVGTLVNSAIIKYLQNLQKLSIPIRICDDIEMSFSFSVFFSDSQYCWKEALSTDPKDGKWSRSVVSDSLQPRGL